MWVLIVMLFADGGRTLSMQEFSSKERCEAAQEFVLKNERNVMGDHTVKVITCMPK